MKKPFSLTVIIISLLSNLLAQQNSDIYNTSQNIPLKEITINSIPKGLVLYIDNKKVGITPFTDKMSIGKHSIIVINEEVKIEEIIDILVDGVDLWSFNVPLILKDLDGNLYEVVKVGTQTWMAENLKTTKFNDSTDIPTLNKRMFELDNTSLSILEKEVNDFKTKNPLAKEFIIFKTENKTVEKVFLNDLDMYLEKNPNVLQIFADNDDWAANYSPAYCWYKNDMINYKNPYGALYNWYAVNTGKLCPIGWHVPSDDDWQTLIDSLGGISLAGGKLKEFGTKYWKTPNKGATNSTGFSAVPGGFRNNLGEFFYIGKMGYWWSSTENNTNTAWSRNMGHIYGYVNNQPNKKQHGYSVRCLKDKIK
jgi:uncharacterized protein (TIGR02145 family)